MNRFLWSLFVIALVVAATLIVGTEGKLPPVVYTHFGPGGRANGSLMTRDAYVALMLALAIGIPLAVVVSMVWIPRVAPRLLSRSIRDRVMDASLRNRTLTAMSGFAAIVGSLVAVFIAGMHLVIVGAHGSTPPRLDNAVFVPVMVAFAVSIVVASVYYHLRCRRA
jgi:hypothetical protein